MRKDRIDIWHKHLCPPTNKEIETAYYHTYLMLGFMIIGSTFSWVGYRARAQKFKKGKDFYRFVHFMTCLSLQGGFYFSVKRLDRRIWAAEKRT